MSAAPASIFLSTSHSDTTSTGATWISRNRSHLPYQPQPIRPTRLGLSSANSAAKPLEAVRASPAALAWRKWRRFMVTLRMGRGRERGVKSKRERPVRGGVDLLFGKPRNYLWPFAL